MTTVPVIPVNTSASRIADLIEDHYSVPRELLDQLADRVAAIAAVVAESAVKEWRPDDWLSD
jgi:hypothetical protein